MMPRKAKKVEKNAWSRFCLYLAGLSAIQTSTAAWASATPPLVDNVCPLTRTMPCSSVRIRKGRSIRPSASFISTLRTMTSANVQDGSSDEKEGGAKDVVKRKRIDIKSSFELPFSAEVAYDAFSDLRRQPSWSPWLRSVEYLNDDGTVSEDKSSKSTLWTMKMKGIKFSWTAIATKNERPNLIQWESTSGLKNFGTVRFEPINPSGHTLMTMNLSFMTPRVIAGLFERSKKVQIIVQDKMIRSSIESFRDVVLENDLQQARHTTGQCYASDESPAKSSD